MNFIKAVFRAWFYGSPSVGDIYVFDDYEKKLNPFNDQENHTVEVTDVARGWVKHRFTHTTSMFQNESCTRSCFNFCYKKK